MSVDTSQDQLPPQVEQAPVQAESSEQIQLKQKDRVRERFPYTPEETSQLEAGQKHMEQRAADLEVQRQQIEDELTLRSNIGEGEDPDLTRKHGEIKRMIAEALEAAAGFEFYAAQASWLEAPIGSPLEAAASAAVQVAMKRFGDAERDRKEAERELETLTELPKVADARAAVLAVFRGESQPVQEVPAEDWTQMQDESEDEIVFEDIEEGTQ